MAKLLEKCTLSEKKAIMRTFIARITIHQDAQEARFHFLKLPGIEKRFAGLERPTNNPTHLLPSTGAGKSFAGPRGPANVPNQIGCGGWI